MKILHCIDDAASKIIEYLIAMLLFAIMILMFGGMIARYFFNSPIIWGDELATYLLVCMTFMGGYKALRAEKLVRVTFVLSLVPPKAEKMINIFAQIMICLFLTIIGYFSVKILSSPVALSQKTVALRMPMYLFYVQIPVMIVLMLIRMVINLSCEMCRGTDGKDGKESK